MAGKIYDVDSFKLFDFSNLGIGCSSDNCYGTCNCDDDINCNCVCNAVWINETKPSTQIGDAFDKAKQSTKKRLASLGSVKVH